MKFTPFRITLFYFAFAVLWITTTDQVLEWMVEDVALLSQFQTVKGLFYITLTAIVLFLMMKSYESYVAKNEKKLEAQEKSLNLALKSAKMAIWEYDTGLDRYIKSENHDAIFGFKKGFDLKLHHVFDRVHPEDKSKFEENANKTLISGEDFDIKYRIIIDDGTIKWLWTKGEPTLKKGKTDKVSGVTIDITESVLLEEKLAAEKELHKKILEVIPVMITIYRPNLSEFTVNAEFEKITGWSAGDINEVDIMTEVYPDEKIRREAEEFMSKPGSGWKDLEMVTKNGEVIQSSWINIRLSDETQIGIGIDITDRKSLEERIDSERRNLKTIFDSMPVFINLHDVGADFGQVNRYFKEKLGYTDQDIEGEDFLKLITTEEGYKRAIKVMEKSNGNWTDFELTTKSGEHVQSTWTNIKIGESSALGIGLDITERKKMEEELRENEERLHLTTVSANIGIWEWHPKTGKTVFDETWANLVGYSLEELEPVSIETWNELLHPDDSAVFEKAVEDYFTGSKPFYECEIRMKHKEGHWVWILDRGQAVDWDENREPVRLVGTHIDISDRVVNEKSLAYQASLLSNVSDAIISVDRDLKIVSWNNAAEKTYGWNREEVLGQAISDVIQTIYESGETTEKVFAMLKDQGNWQGEVIQKDREGKDMYMFSSISQISDADGEITDIISVNRNVTERKQYERENRLLANVFLNSNTALSVSNHKTNQLERVNKAYAQLLGYSEEELIGMDVYELYPEDFRSPVQNQLNLLDIRGYTSFETKLKRKDGSVLDVIINLSIVKDSKYDVAYRVSTVQDISELKEVQEQLGRERNRFEIAAKTVSDVVWEWNPDENEVWWGDGIESVMGYTKEDYEGKIHFWQNHIYEVDRDRVVESMQQAEEGDESQWECEYRFIAADETLRTVKDTAFLIRDEKGKLLRVIGAMVDITQVLEFQNSLQRERNRFELIAKSSNDVLYDFDVATGAVWWSEGWQTRFGYEDSQVENRIEWWANRIKPEDKKKVLGILYEAIESNRESWNCSYRIMNGDGNYRIVEDTGFFIKNDEGENEKLVGTITDVTADIEARDNLKDSEEQYRLLFKQSPLPMYIYDPESLDFIAANDSAIEKYGYGLAELKKMKIYDLHPKEDLEVVKKEISRSLKKKRTGFDVWQQVTKKGEKLTAEISGSEIYYDGNIRRLVVVNDITVQKQAEERAISAIIEGEERERQRIAKELHDGLGQYLSAANMNLESVYEDAQNLSESLNKTFKNGLELLNYAISETRNISQNLLPKAIQDYGLELGIEALINHLRNNSDIQFYLYRNLNGVKIPENIQINLYRIAQEALNNAIRHAQPDSINVQLVYSEGEILFIVEDDGSGFEPDKITGDGLGLKSMKTRVGAMAANIDIVSNLGRGTLVSVVVPLS